MLDDKYFLLSSKGSIKNEKSRNIMNIESFEKRIKKCLSVEYSSKIGFPKEKE